MAGLNKLPEELRKKMLRTRNYLPKWLKERYENLDKFPELNDKNDEISDFLVLIKCIWRISNQDYQNRIWVKHETSDIVDSYDDTTMYFLEDADAVLEATDAQRIKMTNQQYTMLKKLYDMVENYDESPPEVPLEKGESEDKFIVSDPKWHKIRDYAKLVYEEIIKE